MQKGKWGKSEIFPYGVSQEKGNKNARDGQLNAYINQLKAKTNKDIKEDQAKLLIQLTQELMK